MIWYGRKHVKNFNPGEDMSSGIEGLYESSSGKSYYVYGSHVSYAKMYSSHWHSSELGWDDYEEGYPTDSKWSDRFIITKVRKVTNLD